VRRLVDRVHRDGGSARLLRVMLSQPAEQAAVIDDFQAARDAEYAELLERIPELERELAQERARGRTTYAEVEESEADLERFRSWLAKIAARTTSPPPATPWPAPRSSAAPRPWPPSRPPPGPARHPTRDRRARSAAYAWACGDPLLVELLGGCPTPTTRQASGGDRHLKIYEPRDNLPAHRHSGTGQGVEAPPP
jgi:hypothetical protein